MRKLLVIMLAVSLSAVMLTGCTNSAENVEDIGSEQIVTEEESQVITEESEVASEEISETESENSSEEVSEEVIVDYSAENIMALCDKLEEKYPIENPDHIRATMIMANLDHISEEDLEVLFSTYGYDYAKLETLFIEYLDVLYTSVFAGFRVSQGVLDQEVIDQADFLERMPITEVVLEAEDMELAEYCYSVLEDYVSGNGINTDEMFDRFEEVFYSNDCSFAEAVSINYTGGGLYGSEFYYESANIYTKFNITK